ncbi:Hypothetical predicted protein [Mytilus galloprovincialis]|uniref:BTB domain-containing protein n=1 Tax=Mytilus galloprovincialis TaxID=29158 RepID=A0A8B6E246_MYTGA|nr:Hypothetical predicted protein [Mytilus galloprovincialis]
MNYYYYPYLMKMDQLELWMYRSQEDIQSTEPITIYLPDADHIALQMVLSYIYTDRILPTQDGQEHNSNEVILMMMDVYRLSIKFQMGRLEQLCIQYLESCINHKNVLVALHNAAKLSLDSIKEYCLKFIVKESNCNQIVNSMEFESLDKPLMVEIIRRKLSPPHSVRILPEPLQDQVMGRSLEKDLETFLQSAGRDLCDVTLVLDGVEIPAHKAILSARCSYFEALFRWSMPENNKVTIAIGEMIPSRQAFDSLLRYIYYSDTTMPPEDSLYLFPAPHFYGFTNNRLQAYCKHNLEKNVSVQNVVQILEAADKIQALDMKKHALRIMVHNFQNVAHLPELNRLNKDLLLEIIKAKADDEGEVNLSKDWSLSNISDI